MFMDWSWCSTHARDVPFSARCWSILEPVNNLSLNKKKNIQIFYCALLLLNIGLTTESLQLLDPEKHSLVYWLKFNGMQYNRCKLHCWFCCCCSYLPTRFCKDSVSNRRKKHNQVSSSLPQTYTLKLLCHSLLLCSLQQSHVFDKGYGPM